MAQSATLKAEARTKLGSRACRALRANGMIPANLQPADGKEHLDLAINEHEFLAARRNHVHLYDIEIGGQSESVVVRELEWDVFGDSIIHVEFKRVQRGVETETEVELAFVGMPKGVVNHTMQHISIFSLPSMIPDAIEVNVEGLGEGTHILAKDLKLPEGVRLAVEPDAEVAVIAGVREEATTEEGEEGEEGEGSSVEA
ncbi:MAG: 50S ribosomal protein L25 [Planctomycetes bacterium]|nr:50S ribosomal protein L25 [Planctomycetota bacterium]